MLKQDVVGLPRSMQARQKWRSRDNLPFLSDHLLSIWHSYEEGILNEHRQREIMANNVCAITPERVAKYSYGSLLDCHSQLAAELL